MNSWSRRRKRIILSLIFLSLLVLVGVPVFLLFYRAPTCFDGKQNGDETGLDCGGSCQMLCTVESLPLILKGDPRILSIATSTFEVIALVENPNATGEVHRAGYIFKLYNNTSAVPLRVIEGETFVPKAATFAVFEGPFNLENGLVPTRATFEWRENTLNWTKNTLEKPRLVVRGATISRETTNPRLEAIVENMSLEPVSNIDLVALIFNSEGNIFAASKTFVDNLLPGAEAPIIFSWPQPFKEASANIDIVVRIFPDRSFIR